VSTFDLMNPTDRESAPKPKTKLKDVFKKVSADRKNLQKELKAVCELRRLDSDGQLEEVRPPDIIGAVRWCIEVLAAQERLSALSAEIKNEFRDVFEPIPHVNELPSDMLCSIKLKDANKMIATRTYGSPRKYRNAWSTLIQQHLDAGRIQPLNSAHASPTFLIPKADKLELPRWVNDYRLSNGNTVMDAHPLPRVDDILADCAKGKVWSKLDMTNSFFQTRMDPNDMPLTAVTTPLGLYEWLVMPMGLRNALSIHQRRVIAALRPFIGKICHVYLDNVIVWSNTIEEHTKHLRIVLWALQMAHLYFNPKKCHFYLLELDFLGHHISARGVEANSSKLERVLQWPVPKNTTDACSFLGLVQYISMYLPKLAEHM
jgi:hypothetical protein